jgi:hypothetical protein
MRIYGDCDLNKGCCWAAVRISRLSEAYVLVIAKFRHLRAGRLPVKLIYDLLHIVTNKRLDDCEHARVGSIPIQNLVEVRRPLGESDDTSQLRVLGDLKEDILVAKARPMSYRPRVNPIKGFS